MNTWKPLFTAYIGLRAPLSSHIQEALYKCFECKVLHDEAEFLSLTHLIVCIFHDAWCLMYALCKRIHVCIHQRRQSVFRSGGSSNRSKKFSIRTEKKFKFFGKVSNFLFSRHKFLTTFFSPQLKKCKKNIRFKFAFLRKYSPLTPSFSFSHKKTLLSKCFL